jgi:hypothetical protein
LGTADELSHALSISTTKSTIYFMIPPVYGCKP